MIELWYGSDIYMILTEICPPDQPLCFNTQIVMSVSRMQRVKI